MMTSHRNADEIRQDIEDAVSRMKPWQAEDDSCYFGGWARMAQPLVGFNVVEVGVARKAFQHRFGLGYLAT